MLSSISPSAADFGELEVHPVFALPGTPEILPLKAENHIANKRGSANAAWHADTTMRKDPSAASILRSRISPAIGGDTVFSNTILGYDLLDDEVKERIDGLSAFHDAQVFLNYLSDEKRDEVMADWPGVEHPVVRIHPETGEKAIYVNSIFTRHIVGVSPEESDALLRILFDQVKLPELQCRFSWRTNSVAFWDNRSCQHYGVNDYVGERHMERVTIAGDVPFGPNGKRRTSARSFRHSRAVGNPSRLRDLRSRRQGHAWIPAFAGMTKHIVVR